MRPILVLPLLLSFSVFPAFLSFVHTANTFSLVSAFEPAVTSDLPLLHQFENKYKHATRLQCNFLQRYSENGRLARTEAGKAYFLHPGKMRWEYEVPEKNTFLVDGKYVWFYSPTDHTATRTPTKNSEDWRTPLAFLTGDVSLSRICAKIDAVKDLPPFSPSNSVFRCLLRRKSGGEPDAIRTVLFEITPDGDLGRIVVPQEGGIEHEFIFKDWQWNSPVPKNWFVFQPPRGVVIVDGLLPPSLGVRQ
jgi:outer membrane lipoprotein carrier protein